MLARGDLSFDVYVQCIVGRQLGVGRFHPLFDNVLEAGVLTQLHALAEQVSHPAEVETVGILEVPVI